MRHLSSRGVVHACARHVGYQGTDVQWTSVDLLDPVSVRDWFKTANPDTVVHCAALVNVDACEADPGAATQLHVEATRTIRDNAAATGANLVYISTDSVFDGVLARPYKETDQAAPKNAYARSKHEGEAVALEYDRATVVRTNIFGWSLKERLSFAEWLLQGLVMQTPLRMFRDVFYTPIHAGDLAEVLDDVVEAELRGLFHAGGSTVMSKYDFAMLLASAFGLSTAKVEATTIESSGLRADRPKNMALDNSLLERALRRPMPSAADGVARFRQEFESGWLAEIKGRAIGTGFGFGGTHA